MNQRPLLDRLVDIEHVLKLDKLPLFAQDIREAIDEIVRLRELLKSVDVQVPERGLLSNLG